MLLFAHTGITLGTAKIMARAAGWREKGLPAQLDYRLVLIGSMLPDLIDKPLGGVIPPLGNGRIYSHTRCFYWQCWWWLSSGSGKGRHGGLFWLVEPLCTIPLTSCGRTHRPFCGRYMGGDFQRVMQGIGWVCGSLI